MIRPDYESNDEAGAALLAEDMYDDLNEYDPADDYEEPVCNCGLNPACPH